MSFFERAKAAASDLAAKADAEMKKAGITRTTAGVRPGPVGRGPTGRCVTSACWPISRRPAARHPPTTGARVLATLRELESSGRLGPLTVAPAAYGTPGAPPPPPPGAALPAAAG